MAQSLPGGQAAAIDGGALAQQLARQIPSRLAIAVQQLEVIFAPCIKPASRVRSLRCQRKNNSQISLDVNIMFDPIRHSV